jgi:hypothetical protein
MSELAWALVTGTIFKTAVILSGTVCMVMGYRLFCRGIGGTADLKAGGEGLSLVLRGAAPGTFFALFGATLVGITAWRGVDVQYGAQGAGVSDKWASEKSTVVTRKIGEFWHASNAMVLGGEHDVGSCTLPGPLFAGQDEYIPTGGTVAGGHSSSSSSRAGAP